MHDIICKASLGYTNTVPVTHQSSASASFIAVIDLLWAYRTGQGVSFQVSNGNHALTSRHVLAASHQPL
jgi:hypothetical protein